jgi:hypothetical protein
MPRAGSRPPAAGGHDRSPPRTRPTAGRRAGRPSRAPPGRPRQPHRPTPPTPGEGDGSRCPLTPFPQPAQQRAVPRRSGGLSGQPADRRAGRAAGGAAPQPPGTAGASMSATCSITFSRPKRSWSALRTMASELERAFLPTDRPDEIDVRSGDFDRPGVLECFSLFAYCPSGGIEEYR